LITYKKVEKVELALVHLGQKARIEILT